jgi:acyl carrier protein
VREGNVAAVRLRHRLAGAAAPARRQPSSIDHSEESVAMSSNITSPEAVFERIAEIVAAQIRTSQSTLTPQTHLAGDLGMDSLEKVELVVQVERTFHVSLDREQAPRCETLADLTAAVLQSSEGSPDGANV